MSITVKPQGFPAPDIKVDKDFFANHCEKDLLAPIIYRWAGLEPPVCKCNKCKKDFYKGYYINKPK